MPKTLVSIKGALSEYTVVKQCHDVLMQMPYELWKKETNLGIGYSRSTGIQAFDKELKEYHRMANASTGSIEDQESLAVQAAIMYYALKNWKREQGDKDPKFQGPDRWKTSKRNASGFITRMDAALEKYIKATTDYNRMQLPESHMELFAWQMRENEKLFHDQFKNARFVAKKSFLRETALNVVTEIGDKTGLTDMVKGGLSDLGSAIMRTEFVQKLVTAVSNMFKTGTDHAIQLIKDIVTGLGIDLTNFTHWLEGAAKAVAHFISTLPGINLAKDIGECAVAFYGALKAHLQLREGQRNRFIAREGSVGDAYDTVTNFWLEERNDKLREGATSLTKAVVKGVLSALSSGVAEVVHTVTDIAMKVYKAAKAIWDKIKEVLDIVKEKKEVEEALRNLWPGTLNDTKKIFETSPLLACYYFLCVPTSHLVMLDNHLAGLSGFMTLFETLKGRIDPVIEKAAEYLKDSKFMFVKEDGTCPPVKSGLNDPTILEQIKEAIKSKFSDSVDDVRDGVLDSIKDRLLG